MLQFYKPKLSDKQIFNEYIKNSKELLSEMSFAVHYIWQNSWSTEICITEDAFFTIGYKDGEIFAFSPIIKSKKCVCKSLLKLKEYFDYKHQYFEVECVPKNIADHVSDCLGDKFRVIKDRDNFDYIYLSSDLRDLPGRKYHSKRNHISQFENKYSYEYLSMTPELAKQCIEKNIEWQEARGMVEDQTLVNERAAIDLALRNMQPLGLKGGVLLADGEIAAFAVGEVVNPRLGIVHFEKANTNFTGSYAVINKLFAENEFSQVEYINRQEDMGLPGLRKAKLSYYPNQMVWKGRLQPKAKNE